MIARYAIPFFFIMTLIVAPAVIALLCRWLAPSKYWKRVASVITVLIWMLIGYGSLSGFRQLEVKEIVFVSADLPAAFDGYRIVQFSDAHVATFSGSGEWLLKRAVETINQQQADAIVFTGDLQNIWPEELAEHIPVLSQLHAKDGVYSVLGNHDYAVYQNCDEAQKARNCLLTQQEERKMGWDLLLNEHRVIRRGNDSIVIAGMENWGKVKRMPRQGDVAKTLKGVSDSAFVIMLQHDPSAWREKILPESRAQLTLSGHTHGGQVSLFGWSPASMSYDEWKDTTYEGDRAINVSVGMGALIPFRLGIPGEIVVITLKVKKVKGEKV